MRTFIAIVLIAQVAAYGQQPGAPNVPKGTYKFEVNSQLVVVNVSAKDKNGAPLDGLKPADFTITEDGKAQQVKVFEFQRLEEAADLTTPAPRRPRWGGRGETGGHAGRHACKGSRHHSPGQSRRSEVQGPPPDGDVLRPGGHARDRSDSRPTSGHEVPQEIGRAHV